MARRACVFRDHGTTVYILTTTVSMYTVTYMRKRAVVVTDARNTVPQLPSVSVLCLVSSLSPSQLAYAAPAFPEK